MKKARITNRYISNKRNIDGQTCIKCGRHVVHTESRPEKAAHFYCVADKHADKSKNENNMPINRQNVADQAVLPL